MASTQIPVVITFHRPGTQPPLYLAGTFSNPPWQPHEMDHAVREDGEYDFKKEVHGEPGSKIQYKFRIGDGDWWVLKDDGPTETDDSGNTNNILEVKSEQEASQSQDTDHQGTQGTQDIGDDDGGDRPLSYAKVAINRLQPSTEQTTADRSATGTPIPAKVAAEVADSAELLHEEVPERERDEASVAKQSGRRMSEEAETAAEVAESAEALDGQGTIVILEPSPGEGSPFKMQPRGETLDHQDEYVADNSPLFSHECVGMYEPDEAPGGDEEDESVLHATEVQDFDPHKVDLNDPTLEHFPSARDDIIDTVRKLESGLPVDHASFNGKYPSPVVNPSRRGTEDITGDFSLAPPSTSSPPTQRPPKKSPRGSIGSLNATASLHSISEDEEPGEELAEEESTSRPTVVFSNPLKAKPKYLRLPASDEDEGVALREGVSPRTVTPDRPPFMTSEASPAHSPPSPSREGKGGQPDDESNGLTSAEAELDKHKERSLEETGPPNPGSNNAENHKGPSSSTEPPSGKGAGENKSAAPQSSDKPGDTKDVPPKAPRDRRPSYAEVAASKPPHSDDPAESKTKSPQPVNPSDSKTAGPETAGARRPCYAEVTASKPGPADDKDKGKGKATTASAPESSAPTSATTTARDVDTGKDQPESADLRKRGGARGEQSAATGEGEGASPPAVKFKQGAGWIKAVFRVVFVDSIGGFVKGLLRMFSMGWVLSVLGVKRQREE